MTFTIDEIYKNNIPRGVPIVPPFKTWDTSNHETLEYETDTDMATRIRGILWSPSGDFSHTEGASDPKFLSISYPTEDGSAIKTVNIANIRELLLLSKRVNVYENPDAAANNKIINYYLLEFEAPVVLKHNNSEKKITITFGSGTIGAGELVLAIIGWEKAESEWD